MFHSCVHRSMRERSITYIKSWRENGEFCLGNRNINAFIHVQKFVLYTYTFIKHTTFRFPKIFDQIQLPAIRIHHPNFIQSVCTEMYLWPGTLVIFVHNDSNIVLSISFYFHRLMLLFHFSVSHFSTSSLHFHFSLIIVFPKRWTSSSIA